MSETNKKWLDRAQKSFKESTSYFDTNLRRQWEDNIRMVNNRHPVSSKYNTELFQKRSRIFRPKTRSSLMKFEAAVTNAFFSTVDLLSVEPENGNAPEQVASAKINKNLVEHRLKTSIPWFQTLVGAASDCWKMGTVISHEYWEYEEDEEGNILPHDGKSSGEILLRGLWIARNYYNAPLTKDSFTKDGYFRSGDAGTLDTEGYLKITDRIKDVIKSGGEWISSIDMENVLVSHSGILEAAVVGLPHPKWDERPLALVVLREGYESTTKEQFIEYLSKFFAKWQIPDEILFVQSIPRTSVGKLNKKVIRDEYKNLYTN